MLFSTETTIRWVTALLLISAVLALLSGALALVHARRQTLYFRLRRQAALGGMRRLMFGVGMLVLAGTVAVYGQPAVEVFLPPTPIASPISTFTPTLTVTLTPTQTPLPSDTLPPTETLSPSATLTPSLTPTPTVSGTPGFPRVYITLPAGTITVTPPAGAVIANARVGRFNDCVSERGVATTFTPNPKPLYVLFDYDGWLPGVRWSNVWTRAGEVIYTETLLWDGSTGGCGFAEYDHGGQEWMEGNYEVQIFVGDQWVGSTQFTISR